jgi:hypothetical protein
MPKEITMWLTVIINAAVVIGLGVIGLWGWVAFFSEIKVRRFDHKQRIPYPDDVAWRIVKRYIEEYVLTGRNGIRRSTRSSNAESRRLGGRIV